MNFTADFNTLGGYIFRVKMHSNGQTPKVLEGRYGKAVNKKTEKEEIIELKDFVPSKYHLIQEVSRTGVPVEHAFGKEVPYKKPAKKEVSKKSKSTK